MLHNFPQVWQPWLEIITKLLPLLLVIVIVFSAQFNHSRLSLLTGVLLSFTLLRQYTAWNETWFVQHDVEIILFNTFLLLILGISKDRGLLSIHGIYRIVGIAFFACLAWGWLYVYQTYIMPFINDLPSKSSLITFLTIIKIELLFIITAAILLWRSFSQISSLAAALFITLLYWIFYYYHLVEVPWALTYFVLGIYYLCVVVVDSYFLAYRDELTTLPSRRALNQLSLSLGRKYTVAMLDIDHFKKFNDTYGHDIGDQVLKLVAAKLAKVNGGGKVFRYGGEEFTIVFPRKTIAEVKYVLEEVRESIADYGITIRHPVRSTKQARKNSQSSQQKKVSVTISIGVASRKAKQNFEQTLKAADQALYRAKKAGRNNVSQ